MKNLKNILTLTLVLLAINAVFAQNYYANMREIVGDGFVYKCVEEEYFGLVVYNSNNRLTDVWQTLRNGTPIEVNMLGASSYDNRSQVDEKILSIVNTVLSAKEKGCIKSDERDWILIISGRASSDTGEILEVEFSFGRESGNNFLSIPPEKLYAIEQQIKRQVCLELTDFGKSVNYAIFSSEISCGLLN